MGATRQEIAIDFNLKTRALKDVENVIAELNEAGKLENVNGNTYKALMTKIAELRKLLEPPKDGIVSTIHLKQIQRGFSSVEDSLTKIIGQEKSAGIEVEEYIKKLEEATQAVNNQKKALSDLQAERSKLSVDSNGKVKGGQAAAMAKASKGAKSQGAQDLLASGNMKAIKTAAKDSNHPDYAAATEALQVYNKWLKKQSESYVQLSSEIEGAKEQLNSFQQQLTEIQEIRPFHPDAIKGVEELRDATHKVNQATTDEVKHLENVGASHGKVVKTTQKLESSTTKAAKSFIKFAIVTRTLQKVFKEGIRAVGEMDKALTDMSIVTGESRAQLQSMIPAFNALGRATGATATETAGLTAEYMKQGRTMKDSLVLAEQTAKAAKISGISAAESVEYMTSAINGFSLAAKDAEHVSDVFAKLGATTATDYKDLAIALSKVSAQANTAGMSMEFTTTLLAKGLEVTQEAPESIGTALKTILARMRELKDYGSTLEDGQGLNKVENALGAVGVALRDTNGQFRDMEEIFNELGPQWDNLTGLQQQAIAQSIAGTRQQSRFLAIMQDWDRTVEMSNASLQAEGATMYQHAQYAKSLEFSMNKLTTAWQGFVSGLVDSDLVRNFLSFVADAISGVTTGINWINEHTGGLVGTLITLIVPITLVVNMIAEQVRLHKEQAALVHQQYQDMQEANMTEAEKLTLQNQQTVAMREQANLQTQINGQTDVYYSKLEKVSMGMKGIWAQLKLGLKEGWESGTAEVQIARLKRIQSLQNRLDKDQNLSIKKRQKLEKKLEKEKKRYNKTERKQEIKARKERIKDNTKKQAEAKKQTDAKRKEYEDLKKKHKKRADVKKELIRLEAEEARLTEEIKNDNQAINELSDKKLSDEQVSQHYNNAEVATSTIVKENEEDIAESTEHSTDNKQEEVGSNAANTTLTKAQAKAEKEKGTSIFTTIGLKVKELAANAMASLASIAGFFANPATMPFAITGLALLAAAGIATGVAAGVKANSAGGKGEKNSKAIGENQNALYETREKKQEISEYRDEYAELINKANKTAEDEERIKEIEEAIKEVDSDIAGSGTDLLASMDKQIAILERQEAALIDTNQNLAMDTLSAMADERQKHPGRSEDELYHLDDKTKLAIKQGMSEDVKNFVNSGDVSKGLSDSEKTALNNSVQNMIGNLDEEQLVGIASRNEEDLSKEEKKEYKQKVKDKKAEYDQQLKDLKADYKSGKMTKEEYEASKKQLKAAKKSVNIDSVLDEEAFSDVGETATLAAKEIISQSGNGLQAQLKTYADTVGKMEEGAAKDMIKKQFGGLEMLSSNLETVNQILDNDVLGLEKSDAEAALQNFANSLNEAGISADGMKKALEAVGEGGFESLANLTDEELAEILGTTTDDPEFQAKKRKILEESLYALAGTDDLQLSESRTKMRSEADNVVDVQSKLLNGEELTQEEEQMLANKFGDLWGNSEFQNNLFGDGDRAAAVNAMNAAQEKDRQRKVDSGKALIAGKEDLINNLLSQDKYANIGGLDAVSKMSADEMKQHGMSDEDISYVQRLLGEIATNKRDVNALENLEFKYNGMSEKDIHKANREESRNKIQTAIDKQGGIGSIKQFEDLKKIQAEEQAELQADFDETFNKIADGVVNLDAETGELLIDQAAYANLSDAEKKIIDDQIDLLREKNDALQESKQLAEDILQQELDSRIEMENQGIEVMKARLDAEYEATQESLNKRRDLYSKYFDSLDQEASIEESEDKRQSLLNRIASLSTATDADSLGKLKEAQQALADLDKEQMQSERDLRRAAVEESFDSQEEELDSQYEEAMANVQGLWEEFVNMQREDQEALFREYGDSFQEVTDTAAQSAAIAMNKYLNQLPGSVRTDETGHKYASGGLVDYTGPAWVDGSKSAPEAFLDAEDTQNIAQLAQGLRVLMQGGGVSQNGEDVPTVAIHEININVGANGTQAGQDAADGFIKALKEWGLNVNKND